MNIVIWGTGKDADEYMKHLHPMINKYVKIKAFIDSSANKTFFHDFPVYLPTKINRLSFDKIVVMTRLYEDEILLQINRMKYVDNKCVLCEGMFYTIMLDIVKDLGASVCVQDRIATVDASQINKNLLNQTLMQKIRGGGDWPVHGPERHSPDLAGTGRHRGADSEGRPGRWTR